MVAEMLQYTIAAAAVASRRMALNFHVKSSSTFDGLVWNENVLSGANCVPVQSIQFPSSMSNFRPRESLALQWRTAIVSSIVICTYTYTCMHRVQSAFDAALVCNQGSRQQLPLYAQFTLE